MYTASSEVFASSCCCTSSGGFAFVDAEYSYSSVGYVDAVVGAEVIWSESATSAAWGDGMPSATSAAWGDGTASATSAAWGDGKQNAYGYDELLQPADASQTYGYGDIFNQDSGGSDYGYGDLLNQGSSGGDYGYGTLMNQGSSGGDYGYGTLMNQGSSGGDYGYGAILGQQSSPSLTWGGTNYAPYFDPNSSVYTGGYQGPLYNPTVWYPNGIGVNDITMYPTLGGPTVITEVPTSYGLETTAAGPAASSWQI